MNLCLCGCGAEVKKRYVRGHQFRSEAKLNAPQAGLSDAPLSGNHIPGTLAIIPTSLTGPPPWPASIDRSRWRLAEDRPGTDIRNPWIETKCHSCLQTMWARDPLSTWERGGCCEECSWIARESFGEQIVKRGNATRGPYNPFA